MFCSPQRKSLRKFFKYIWCVHWSRTLQFRAFHEDSFPPKVSLTLGCPMDLQLFPLDSQTCHISVASYGWTSDDVIYLWRVSCKHETGVINSKRIQYNRVVISASRTNQYTEKPLSSRRVCIGEIWSQQSKLFDLILITMTWWAHSFIFV